MTPADAALEAEINLAALRLATATNPRDRRDAWAALCDLQPKRTPERVQEMEHTQGLRR